MSLRRDALPRVQARKLRPHLLPNDWTSLRPDRGQAARAGAAGETKESRLQGAGENCAAGQPRNSGQRRL